MSPFIDFLSFLSHQDEFSADPIGLPSIRRARAVRTAQVKRLAELVARKGAVEKLAVAYERVRGEVAGAVEARVAGLEGAVGALEGLKKVGVDEEEGEEERREGDVQMALDGVVEGLGDGEERVVGRGMERKRVVEGRE